MRWELSVTKQWNKVFSPGERVRSGTGRCPLDPGTVYVVEHYSGPLGGDCTEPIVTVRGREHGVNANRLLSVDDEHEGRDVPQPDEPEVFTWRPIAEAPRDGTPVVARGERECVYECVCRGGIWFRSNDGYGFTVQAFPRQFLKPV